MTFNINNNFDLRLLHRQLQDKQLFKLVCERIHKAILQINKHKQRLLDQGPWSKNHIDYHLNQDNGVSKFLHSNPVSMFANLFSKTDKVPRLLQNSSLVPSFHYQGFYNLTISETFYYFLVVPIPISQTSANCLQIAIPVRADLSFHPSYTLHFSRLFKLKIIYLDYEGENTLTQLSLDLMHKLYNDPIYFYARPVTRAEIEQPPRNTHVGPLTNVHYIITPYIDGMDLGAYRKATSFNLHQKCDLTHLVWIMLYIAHDLYAVNESKYMLKDLKLNNVLITADHKLRLLDIEEAQLIVGKHKPLASYTNLTPVYAAPRVLASDAPRVVSPVKRLSERPVRSPVTTQVTAAFHLSNTQSETSSPRLRARSKSLVFPILKSDSQKEEDTAKSFYDEINYEAAILLEEECQHDLHTFGMLCLELALGTNEFFYFMGMVEKQLRIKKLGNSYLTLEELSQFYECFKRCIQWHQQKIKTSHASQIPTKLLDLIFSMLQKASKDAPPTMTIAKGYSELKDLYKELSGLSTEEINDKFTKFANHSKFNYQDLNLYGSLYSLCLR